MIAVRTIIHETAIVTESRVDSVNPSKNIPLTALIKYSLGLYTIADCNQSGSSTSGT